MKAPDDQQHRHKPSTESEREKTKLRERRRRSITSRILYGLRKHGSYDLPPRADINDVLKALANEAGWEVDADGTTYRRSVLNSALAPPLHHICPAAGAPAGNFLSNMSALGFLDLRAGDCSTTASPRHFSTSSLMLRTSSAFSSPFPSPASSEGVPGVNPFVAAGALANGFMAMDSVGFKDELPAASILPSADALDPKDWISLQAAIVNSSSGYCFENGLLSNSLHQAAMKIMIPTLPQFSPFLQEEAKASNQNTPIGSPQRYSGNL